jgi:hypothetical protein
MTIDELVRMQELAAEKITGTMVRIGLNNIMWACTAEFIGLAKAVEDWASYEGSWNELGSHEVTRNLLANRRALREALERQG